MVSTEQGNILSVEIMRNNLPPASRAGDNDTSNR